MEDAALGGLIGDIYDAALVDTRWPSVMAAVGRFFDCHVGAVMFVSSAKGRCERILGSPDRQDSVQDYMENWSGRDRFADLRTGSPRRPCGRGVPDIARATAALREGEVCTDEMFVERAALERTAFYQEHLSHFDYDYALGAKIWQGCGGTGLFSMSRAARGGPFAEHDIRLFGRLQPHLRRALAIGERCAWTRASAGRGDEAARCWPIATAVLDQMGRCGYLNPAAEALLARREGIGLVRERLQAQDPAADARLEAALRLAVDGNTDGRRTGGAVAIPRPGVAAPLSVLVAPAGSSFDWFLPQRPRAVVTMVDPDVRVAPAPDRLCALFGLTGSEAAVAIGIGRGHELKEVAADLNLTADSARQYLSRVYAKTGTARRNDLTRLVAGLGAAS